MPATYNRQVFGSRNAEGVQVYLPQGFMERRAFSSPVPLLN